MLSPRAIKIACWTIVIASIVLKPFYPKSVVIGLLVLCTWGAIASLWFSIGQGRALATKYDGAKLAALAIFLGMFGTCVWGLYLSLRSLSLTA